MKDISENIKKVLAIFLIMFVTVMSYLLYIYSARGEKIVNSPFNQRLWYERVNVVRGNIRDRDGNVLVESKGIKDNVQTLNYKGGAAFAHILGYMDKSYGLTGLQRLFDEDLMGKQMGIFNPSDEKGKKHGYDLKTTLDSQLQKKAYNLLNGKKGAVVAIDPRNGELLSVVSTPSYDPNKLQQDWKRISTSADSPLLNRAIAGMYPPGSTFKIITAASALKNIDNIKTEIYKDEGALKFGDSTSIKNFAGEVLGNINLKQAITHSSNAYFGNLGIRLGNNKLKETAEGFMFNKDIPAIGLLIENSKFPEISKSSKGDMAQSAIGQGQVLATPMEMALVASAVANKGKIMKPILVTETYNKNRIIKRYHSEVISQPIMEDDADYLKAAMREVVKSGTGKNAAIPGIQICGKTGTAEHPESKKDHSWFIGFGPYENPTMAIAVIVEEGGTGASSAAPIARELFRTYLK
ncbi:peptidoglycan glycosyltransferase [Hathewaya proteolytica DSM 3090]|uniref:Peptidoglycan glycosyltransferase n=1 Tax=Hathewaya proteolytica DSM 3090 TaxID=1121331 RepID=A0A1M6NG78_9CLOT|nr:penicillin-binding transpeptidase domain-containing protein [Hathewaya proteolytica]SHJ94679.1 peptidoglycan glycosyltransferase [Hathewaya proteolytica DSM 3090]